MKIDQLFESGDDLASQFAQMAKDKGMNVRVRGTPDQERQRTQDMLAQRRADQEKQSQLAGEKDFANLDQLEAEYAKMKDEYQSLGGSNWQYADREQNLSASERKARSMEDGLRALWSRIQRAKKYSGGVAEGDDRTVANIKNYERELAKYKKFNANGAHDVKIKNLEKIIANLKSKQGVAEGDALADFLAKGGKIHQLPYKKPRKADKTDYGSKHIGGSGDKMKSSRTGKAAKTQGTKVVGVGESAPKGWEGTVKAMKKHKEIDNPYALTNWMKNKGYKSHKKESMENHPDEKEDKALIRQMVKKQALKRENMMAKEQHEDHEISMATSELKNVYINAKKLFDIIKKRSEQEGLDAWQQSKITKASDYLNSVLTAIRGEPRR